MLAAGFLDEVKALRARGDLVARTCPRCAASATARPGKRWTAQWPIGELRERGIAATRQLAKRQITWLRSMPQRAA